MRADDLSALKDQLLCAALRHVVFDGWTNKALVAGARDLKLGAGAALRAFPGGAAEAALHFSDYADRRMLAELEHRNLAAFRVRDRIALAVRVRLEGLAPWREAVRRALSFLAMTQNAPAAMAATYRTVDAIWYAAGDTATDFNFYTKRGLLTGIYAATVLYWLSDKSDGQADTWAFLERRIDEIMAIPKIKSRFTEALAGFVRPFSPFRRGDGA